MDSLYIGFIANIITFVAGFITKLCLKKYTEKTSAFEGLKIRTLKLIMLCRIIAHYSY